LKIQGRLERSKDEIFGFAPQEFPFLLFIIFTDFQHTQSASGEVVDEKP